MVRFRQFVSLCLVATLLSSNAAIAQILVPPPVPVAIWRPVTDGGLLLRVLMMRSSMMLSELETLRAGGFNIPVVYTQQERPEVIPAIVPANTWGAGFANMLFAQPIPPPVPVPPVGGRPVPGMFGVPVAVAPITLRTMDYYLSIPVNTFKIEAANLYERYVDWFMGTNRAVRDARTGIFLQPANVADQFQITWRASVNAVSAVYFYIEAARRTYLIANPYLRTCQGAPARAYLITQLMVLERMALEIRQLMAQIRYSLPYRLPFPVNCIDLAPIPGIPFAWNGPIVAAPNFPAYPYFNTIVPPNFAPAAQPLRPEVWPGPVGASLPVGPGGAPFQWPGYPQNGPAPLPARPGNLPAWQMPIQPAQPGLMPQGQVPQMQNGQDGQPLPLNEQPLLQGPPPPPASPETNAPFPQGPQGPQGAPQSNW